MQRGNWTDKPCYYVTARDAGRTALLLGPFVSETMCRRYAYRTKDDGGDFHRFMQVNQLCTAMDPRAHFYSYGMAKIENGHREGIFNRKIADYERDHHRTTNHTTITREA